MSKYIKPNLEYVSFKIEERLATTCTGSCDTDEKGWREVSPGNWQEVQLVAFNYSVH